MKPIHSQLKLGLLVWVGIIIGGFVSYSHNSWGPMETAAIPIIIVGASSGLCSIGIKQGGWEPTKNIVGIFVAVLTFVILIGYLTQKEFTLVGSIVVEAATLLVWGLVWLQNKVGYLLSLHFGLYVDGIG